MLGSLARISRNSGVPLGGKDCFLPFITDFLMKSVNQAKHSFTGMIFITSYGKLHFSGNFWTFKTQSTQYDYIFVENYIYKKLKEAVEIYKKQTKNQKV